jgi:hypothetical protein
MLRVIFECLALDLDCHKRDHKTKIDTLHLASLFDTGSISIPLHTVHYITLPSLPSPPTLIMLRSCIVCRAEASPDLQLQYCAVCQSALYCSKACQRKDWNKQHKQICKLLNVGHGDMQLRTDIHMNLQSEMRDAFERSKCILDEDAKLFFRLFEESTFEGSQAAARKMKKIAKRKSKRKQEHLLLYSLSFLAHSDSEMLLWPNSPLLVLLQLVDPNTPRNASLQEVRGIVTPIQTPLQFSVDLADPSDYSTHVNQLILAKQLIENGANVNAASIPIDMTPLHRACHAGIVTNLDFIELLLEKGANPNAQDSEGMTPMMYTTPNAPGAATFLLNWPTTDANITTRSGRSFLDRVRGTIWSFSDRVARPDNPDSVQDQFLLRQWHAIHEMLVERGAADTSITALD